MKRTMFALFILLIVFSNSFAQAQPVYPFYSCASTAWSKPEPSFGLSNVLFAFSSEEHLYATCWIPALRDAYDCESGTNEFQIVPVYPFAMTENSIQIWIHQRGLFATEISYFTGLDLVVGHKGTIDMGYVILMPWFPNPFFLLPDYRTKIEPLGLGLWVRRIQPHAGPLIPPDVMILFSVKVDPFEQQTLE